MRMLMHIRRNDKMKQDQWVEIKLFGEWKRAILIKTKDDGKHICITGFGTMAMLPKNVRELEK
jgi:hypothetical protein